MRIEPKPDAALTPEEKKLRAEEMTRKVAIAVAFVSVFYFFIKLLFL